MLETHADCDLKNGMPVRNKWTVPLSRGFGKVFRIGKLPFDGSVAAFSNVVRSDNGPDWTLYIQLALLLPKSNFSR